MDTFSEWIITARVSFDPFWHKQLLLRKGERHAARVSQQASMVHKIGGTCGRPLSNPVSFSPLLFESDIVKGDFYCFEHTIFTVPPAVPRNPSQ